MRSFLIVANKMMSDGFIFFVRFATEDISRRFLKARTRQRLRSIRLKYEETKPTQYNSLFSVHLLPEPFSRTINRNRKTDRYRLQGHAASGALPQYYLLSHSPIVLAKTDIG